MGGLGSGRRRGANSQEDEGDTGSSSGKHERRSDTEPDPEVETDCSGELGLVHTAGSVYVGDTVVGSSQTKEGDEEEGEAEPEHAVAAEDCWEKKGNRRGRSAKVKKSAESSIGLTRSQGVSRSKLPQAGKVLDQTSVEETVGQDSVGDSDAVDTDVVEGQNQRSRGEGHGTQGKWVGNLSVAVSNGQEVIVGNVPAGGCC